MTRVQISAPAYLIHIYGLDISVQLSNQHPTLDKSKSFTAQKNELLCKVIAHNIVVLIHEMHELGIKPDFNNLNGEMALAY